MVDGAFDKKGIRTEKSNQRMRDTSFDPTTVKQGLIELEFDQELLCRLLDKVKQSDSEKFVNKLGLPLVFYQYMIRGDFKQGVVSNSTDDLYFIAENQAAKVVPDCGFNSKGVSYVVDLVKVLMKFPYPTIEGFFKNSRTFRYVYKPELDFIDKESEDNNRIRFTLRFGLIPGVPMI